MANSGAARKREREVAGENDTISNVCVVSPSHISQVGRIQKCVSEQIWPWNGCEKEQVDAGVEAGWAQSAQLCTPTLAFSITLSPLLLAVSEWRMVVR